MLKCKLQYFGPLTQRANSLENTLLLLKIEGKRRRGQQRMRWLDSVTDSMNMNLSKLPEPTQTHVIESVMPSIHLILCLSLLLLPSIFPSIGIFPNKLALCIRWLKNWLFSFSISPDEYSGLISFRIDWFDLLAVHGNLKSLQHYSSKTSVLHAQPSLWSNSHIWT